MPKYELQATLEIKFSAEAHSPEEALAAAVKSKDYEVTAAHFDKPPEGYITTTELAKRRGYTSPRYIRAACARGNVPGAVKIGRDWCVPADCAYFETDHRITDGTYVGSGWYQKYGRDKYQQRKASKASQEQTDDTTE